MVFLILLSFHCTLIMVELDNYPLIDVDCDDVRANFMSTGWILLVNKPMGWTSFDVVNKLRFIMRRMHGLKKYKLGHAGTLDPLATGLLILAGGRATKVLHRWSNEPKIYSGIIQLGATTSTYDAEVPPDAFFETKHITDEMIESCRQHFIGTIHQKPPIFSAIKKEGTPLYKSARQGKEVEVESRPITIYDLALSRIDEGQLAFRCTCSKGTYVRSLAYDIGRYLQSGAYLKSLLREGIGTATLTQAWDLDELINILAD